MFDKILPISKYRIILLPNNVLILFGFIGIFWLCQQSFADARTLVETNHANACGMKDERRALRVNDSEHPEVKLRAVKHPGFSRLVFDWPMPVGCDLLQRGNYIVIAFDRPGRMDVSSLMRKSGDILIGAMVEDDGKQVTLMTREEVDLQVHDEGGSTFVLDLADAAEGPSISPASLNRPEVDVRAGDHADFSRLVFDWPMPIGHDVHQDDERILVTFDRPGRMDLSPLVTKSGGRVIEAVVEDEGRRVVLTTRGRLEMQVRDYESDLLVLDLAGATDEASAGGNHVDRNVESEVAGKNLDANGTRSTFSVPVSQETASASALADGESRRQAPVAPRSATSLTGPGQFDVDDDALDRALERTLTREGVLLLPTGKVEVTPSFAYRRRESRAPTQIDLFGLFAQVRETEVRRDEYDVGMSLDVGLPFDSQLEISQTYRHIDQATMTSAGFVGLEQSEESADVFDDLVIGLAKGLLHEGGWWPDLVARVIWDSDTGDDRDGNIGLGGGSHELTGSLSFLKTRDPLAFFGSLSYSHTFEEDGFKPGDQIGVSLGTTLAAGPDTSLRLALSQSFTGKAEIDDTSIPGSDETSASLTAGASLVLGRGVLLDSSVTAGLTDDAPDYSARIALPVRFDPF